MLDPPGIDAFVCQNAETPASFLPSFLLSTLLFDYPLPTYLTRSPSLFLPSFVLRAFIRAADADADASASYRRSSLTHPLTLLLLLLLLLSSPNVISSTATSSYFALPFSKSSVVGRRRNAHAVNRTAQRVQSASPPTDHPATPSVARFTFPRL